MRLAICDEQWLFASVLASALDRLGHEVVLTTDDPAELLDSAGPLRVDLCVIDVPGPPTTADLGECLHELTPAPYVVLLADSRDDGARDAYDRGFADGLVSKASGLQSLVQAIDAVAGGGRVSEGWLTADRRRQPVVVDALTARELEVVRLVVRGYSTQQMADELAVSRHTIRTHVQQVLRKLGVHGRGKVARAAATAGLVDVSELAEGRHR
ncbi:response regulator transcription factor [Kribbella sp. NBC_01484]|uniref:response regulator transcription factor n=1 Tax=Kribbella sp. NBC_01484 TaxID=2903579 RepID=UPI002E3696D5|nr:response regulator transcription factor [Kribbella sp. NBC_01484]